MSSRKGSTRAQQRSGRSKKSRPIKGGLQRRGTSISSHGSQDIQYQDSDPGMASEQHAGHITTGNYDAQPDHATQGTQGSYGVNRASQHQAPSLGSYSQQAYTDTLYSSTSTDQPNSSTTQARGVQGGYPVHTWAVESLGSGPYNQYWTAADHPVASRSGPPGQGGYPMQQWAQETPRAGPWNQYTAYATTSHSPARPANEPQGQEELGHQNRTMQGDEEPERYS